MPFAFDVQKVSIKAPIKYPANLLAAAANYRSHANEMFGRGAPGAAANEIDPDKVDPVMFAKSPRSCIIDPNEPFFIPPGRNIDWEGELAIIIGKTALNVTEAKAHDYVFGYSIMFDVSDRGGTGRQTSTQFQGPNWFAGKSRDRGAPFGPFIVPKEFAAYPTHLRIVTKVNGVTKQDGNSKDLIWDEAHLVRYSVVDSHALSRRRDFERHARRRRHGAQAAGISQARRRGDDRDRRHRDVDDADAGGGGDGDEMRISRGGPFRLDQRP